MVSNNWHQANGYQYIRKVATEVNPAYKIGDEVVVDGYNGTIHSPRIFLNTGYGYLIKFEKSFIVSNFMAGFRNEFDLFTFREDYIKPRPKTKEVKLNGNYAAIVSKDDVKVGCQTFPYDVIKEIVKAHDSI